MIKWPTVGPDFNQWYSDFEAFSKLLTDNADLPYWTCDFAIKYINIRLDTRKNNFRLFCEGKEEISPDRIVAAINQYKGL